MSHDWEQNNQNNEISSLTTSYQKIENCISSVHLFITEQ